MPLWARLVQAKQWANGLGLLVGEIPVPLDKLDLPCCSGGSEFNSRVVGRSGALDPMPVIWEMFNSLIQT